MPHRVRSSAEYPTWIGFIFIFNLIVGTGALTLPAVFAKAGWLLSLLVLMVLALISFMTVTFVIETMACANAVRNWQNMQVLKRQSDLNNDEDDDVDVFNPTELLLPHAQFLSDDSNSSAVESSSSSNSFAQLASHLERMPLYTQRVPLQYYRLNEKFELGEMAVMFFNDAGRMIFYLCIAVYLYGDLSIYSAAVAKSLRDVICDNNANVTLHDNVTNTNCSNFDTCACWENHTISRFDVYRLFLVGFTMLLGPFAIFGVQKTKYIQMLTVIFRWLAFTFMISIAIKLLISDGPQGHADTMNIGGLPALFGACVYSFMCHHSLPSLLAPIRDKRNLHSLLSYVYLLIAAFYVLLAVTGIFAFAHLEDLYTLNFIPSQGAEDGGDSMLLVVIDYFLALFPVFTLSASFPIIAITLRNNLQTLFLDMTRFESYNIFVRRLLFPLLAIMPPFIITYYTESLTSLVAFTGSYAGACIQYLIPISLVYFARRTCEEILGSGIVNEFRSLFRSTYWLVFVLIWAIACICLVTVNFFITQSDK